MAEYFSRYARSKRSRLAVIAMAALGGLLGAQCARAEMTLPPQTNVRISIVQWMAAKGAYERWDAVGGDFQVSDQRTITLPIIGTISVVDIDQAGLSAEIAKRLKSRVGLIEQPEVSVAVIDYPPIYVVGDVKTPGEYKFRDGLSALQALAMSGGQLRSEEGKNGSQTAELVGELRGLDNSILRSEIRIARLQAEMSGQKAVSFEPTEGQDKDAADAIYKQEQAIFTARANLLTRQSKSFTELRDLLSAEITNLDKKAANSDADIGSVEKELRNIKAMVEKGIALPSKQGDLERMLRSYYAGRLDLTTATMRARQGISEASRNLEGLYDRQRTEVVSELQNEQANLDQLKVKRDTGQKQLLDALSRGANADAADAGDDILAFTVTRRVDGKIEDMAASENTPLQPGDVVHVARKSSTSTEVSGAIPIPTAADRRSGLSQ